MKKFGLALLMLIVILLSVSFADAAIHHIRAGATGANTGEDWTNAWTALPTNLTRGDTYYVADGDYGFNEHIFNDPELGSTYIYIKKATALDHGTTVGWDPSYGDGTAFFGSLQFSESYYVFDGGRREGLSEGYGFKLRGSWGGQKLVFLYNGGGSNPQPAHITIRYTEMEHRGRNTETSDDIIYGIDYGAGGPSDITIQYCYLHDCGRCNLLMRGWNTALIEYCYFSRNASSATNHAEGVSAGNCSNIIIRNNIWEDIEGTAFLSVMYDVNNRWEIYGNLFSHSPDVHSQLPNFDGVAGVVRVLHDSSNNGIANDWKVYNNTIANIQGLWSGFRIDAGENNIAYNNLWFDCVRTAHYRISLSHSWYYNTNPDGDTVNAQMGTGDPFVDVSSKDYRLKDPTNPGFELQPPYDIDMDGRLRGGDGVWDRGAYEYWVVVDTTPPTAPTDLTATAISSTRINLSWTASTDNVGVVGYRIYRDGSQISTTPGTSYQDSGVSPSTTYTYTVEAYDGADNVSDPSNEASATTPAPSDTEPPSVPTGLVATVISSTRIDLAWTASTDNIGVTGYIIYRNGKEIGTTAATSYQSILLKAFTSYTYRVAAYDREGNKSAKSVAVTKTTQPEPTTKFTIGGRVLTIEKANVRSEPTSSGAILGTQLKAAVGAIVEGPWYWNQRWWWEIDFDNGIDGWVAQGKLKKVDAQGQGTINNDGTAPANPEKWVSGYYAGWFWDWQASPANAVAAVDMTTMTHLIFGRYAPGAGTLGGTAGQLVEGAGTGHTTVEDALIAKAHATGVKALAMLGGAGDGPGWVASTAPAVRATFINNIINKCVAKNYDGVDVDWEDSLDTLERQNQLIAFLTELRAAAAARPRYQAPNEPFLITFPGYALNVNIDLPVPAWKVIVASLVDQYNLMSYNMTWNCCGWDTWFFAALKDAGPSHPTSIESSIQAYVDAGVPRSKLGMGLGLYGNGYAPPVTGPRQPMSTEYFWADYQATWADLYMQGMLSSSAYVFDTAAQTGYYSYSPPRTYLGDSVSMLTTEDLESIAAKGAWARAGNCGGTIVWTINYGYVDSTVGNPPMQAVKDAFLSSAPSTYTLSVNDIVLDEGNAGTVNATFTVTLSAASSQTVSVDYVTANGTATAGTDYTATSGTLTFSPGQTSKTISIAVNGDTAVESNETFFVILSSPTNTTLADSQGQGTINNDDAVTDRPTVPTGLTATVISSTEIDLSWTASTDDVGVTGYTLYRNGKEIGTTTGTSYQSTGLKASTNYTYRVAAYDGEGNRSPKSVAVTRTTQPVPSRMFTMGGRVLTIEKANVRSEPTSSGAILGTQLKAAVGIVVGGPWYWNQKWWWEINFDSGIDGWVPQAKLKKIVP